MKSAGKIVLAGGSGYLGRHCRRFFSERGWEVLVLTRKPSRSGDVHWDGASAGAWVRSLEGTDVLLNLAGRTVNCRYHERNRREIFDSRILSTRVLGEALAKLHSPPAVWLNSSSATIYRDARDRPMTEVAGELGAGFSVEVCQAWEREFETACPELPVRKVALRSAMVMGPGNDGVFAAFLRTVKAGMGGRFGDGGQMVSWIHVEDWLHAVEWLSKMPEADGVFNLSSPLPLPNRDFLHVLRAVSRQPFGLPVPRWMLEIGALLLQTETELLLKSRWVLPERLLDSGFRFRHAEFAEAASEILFPKATPQKTKPNR